MRTTLAALAALVLLPLGGCGGGDAASTPAPEGTPKATVLTLEPGPTARCMMPNARTLKEFTEALSGTVTKVEGNEATLDVDHWYAGGDAPQVVVQTSDKPISEQSLLELRQGQRYLISGKQGSVSLCGLSAAWSPDLERLYQQAFPSSDGSGS